MRSYPIGRPGVVKQFEVIYLGYGGTVFGVREHSETTWLDDCVMRTEDSVT